MVLLALDGVLKKIIFAWTDDKDHFLQTQE